MVSPRLLAMVDALPLAPGLRVLEIGCGPGAAAREVARRLTDGRVLAIDRSAAAIRAAEAGPRLPGLRFRQSAAEEFVREPDDAAFDLVFAVRVGALDGRHPALGERVLARIAAATTPTARLFVDGAERDIPRE